MYKLWWPRLLCATGRASTQRASVGVSRLKACFPFFASRFRARGTAAKGSPEKGPGTGPPVQSYFGASICLHAASVSPSPVYDSMVDAPSVFFGGESAGSGVEDSSEYKPSPEHHVLMMRHLRHSQLEHALIRQKAQRFVALKALRRSVELRRQLSRAQQAAFSSTAGASATLTNPPALDPSVKALIDKLTELAEILPSGYSSTQGTTGQPLQRAFHRGDEPNEQHDSITGNPSLATTTTGRIAPQSLPGGGKKEGTIHERSWHQTEETAHLDTAVHQADGSDGLIGEDMDAAAKISHDLGAAEDLLGPSEEEDALGQQLRELDSNMNNMFQDLEKEAKGGPSKDVDVLGKTNAQQENLTEEEKRGKQRQEEERQKERAALLLQLEGLSSGTKIRRPKWRWIADGVDNPHPDRVLKGKHLWKSMALLIIVFFVRPRRTLMQRKAR